MNIYNITRPTRPAPEIAGYGCEARLRGLDGDPGIIFSKTINPQCIDRYKPAESWRYYFLKVHSRTLSRQS
ncbi:MAG: hypothetical protein RMJ55_20140 [Roseiflexaceae bacterium]|nr:hypothetical protein [Roseiflexaceae bacterium]